MFLTDGWKKDVRNYVREADLIGLIAGGAPRDEYESEANDIVERLQAAHADLGDDATRDDIHRIVVHVFSRQFGRMHWPRHKTATLVDSICSRLGIVR